MYAASRNVASGSGPEVLLNRASSRVAPGLWNGASAPCCPPRAERTPKQYGCFGNGRAVTQEPRPKDEEQTP